MFFVFTCLAVFISKSLALQISAFIILSGYFCSLRKRFNSGNRTSKLLCAETIRQIRLVKQITLRKHAYSNILKILPPKISDKNSDIFHISAQNIVYGYSLEPPGRGGSNEYPQSMILSRNKKKQCLPCKPQFYYIKEGFEGVKII